MVMGGTMFASGEFFEWVVRADTFLLDIYCFLIKELYNYNFLLHILSSFLLHFSLIGV
jgi:hypothetical protein